MREMREEGVQVQSLGARIMQFSPKSCSSQGRIFSLVAPSNSLLAVLLCSLSRSLVWQDLLSRRVWSRRAAVALAHWLRLFEPMKARWFLLPRRLQVDLRTSCSPQDPIERATDDDGFFKRSHWELPKPSHHCTGLVRLLIDETWRVTVSQR